MKDILEWRILHFITQRETVVKNVTLERVGGNRPNRDHILLDGARGPKIAGSIYYVSWIQPPQYFVIFSFSCKHWIPKANGMTTDPIKLQIRFQKALWL